jgi:polyribonucleotide nucleotidyltransferase
MTHRINPQIGDKPLIIETGKLAKQADGAVTVQYGETVVLVTAVASAGIREELDFFPLTVDYREKAAAAGKFPGGYFKREGRPTEKEILTARMVDRPCRPLFPEGFYNDTQIISILLSADVVNDPDILVINGASAALSISDIPWHGPIGAVRVGRVNGAFVVNPTHEQREQSDLDLVYAGSETELVMIEGSAKEISEADMMKAIEFGHAEVKKIIAGIKELVAKAGKPKRTPPLRVVRPEVLAAAQKIAGPEILAAILTPGKLDRQAKVSALKTKVTEAVTAQFPDVTKFEINESFYKIEYEAIRTSVLKNHHRPDGRGPRDLRPISCEVGILPRTHGSGLFQRGETQGLVLTTLGAKADMQEMDAWTGGPTGKRFILHYNFPPFSVGETGRTGAPGRREIGHGALAERSIAPMIPAEADFAYTIRLTSEILESNGSSSMASICGGTLSLLDAGVPMKAPVAGISIGLFTDEKTGEAMTVTDIIGSEDHYGDMDFKVAGTARGITGFQTDLKLHGLKFELARQAFEQAREARLVILDKMAAAISGPRTELSKYAPRITTIKINPEKIGAVIGPQGKVIKQIVEVTGCQIDIEDDGSVHIFSSSGEACQMAIDQIRGITAEAEIGKIYRGKVVGIKEFGAFVEILPDKDGLLHISEIADYRVKRVEDVLKMGDEVWVKVLEIDDRGKVRLSRKAALAEKDAEAKKSN